MRPGKSSFVLDLANTDSFFTFGEDGALLDRGRRRKECGWEGGGLGVKDLTILADGGKEAAGWIRVVPGI